MMQYDAKKSENHREKIINLNLKVQGRVIRHALTR